MHPCFILPNDLMAIPKMSREEYWQKQIRRTLILLSVWFVVGLLSGVLLIEPLNEFVFGGIPFGFWMAQQGSIFVFVSLILIYAVASDRLDAEAGLAEVDGESTSGPGAGH
jgi:putative solute:sodium symporter small subunit